MKVAYFDCFSGISGDMTLGALLDAGCDLERLREGLRGLQVPGWELSAEKVWKNGMAATYAQVKTEDQQKHRSLGEILEILKTSQLAAPVRERASAIFQKLGEAEARVHDVAIEKIHFHEVGAADAIVEAQRRGLAEYHSVASAERRKSTLHRLNAVEKIVHEIEQHLP